MLVEKRDEVKTERESYLHGIHAVHEECADDHDDVVAMQSLLATLATEEVGGDGQSQQRSW